MAWLRTVLLRLLLFCGIAFPLGCCLTVDDPNTGPKLFRGVLWIAAVITMFVDWSLLNRRILEYQKAFTTCAETAPPRWEKFTHSFRGLALFALLWFPVQCMRAKDAAEPGMVLTLGVLLLTVTCALWWTLVLGGFTWIRYRIKGRLIPKDVRPSGRPPAPWTVAAFTGPVLWLVFFGAEGAAVLAALGTQLTTQSEDRVELLVELGPDDHIREISGTIALFGGSETEAFPDIDPDEDPDLARTHLVTVPRSAAPALITALALRSEDVDHIELNSAIPLGTEPTLGSCTPSIRLDTTRMWIVQPKLVAVLDTGVESSHTDFYGVVRGTSSDRHGHGTAVAGLVGGRSTSVNAGGVGVHVRSYPALMEGRRSLQDVVADIDDAIDDGAAVINLSFGAVGSPPEAMQRAVAYAEREGVIVVAAAGNRPGGHAREQWPANIPGVVVVGAADSQGRLLASSSSVSGMGNAVLAPGDRVCTTAADGGYQAATGTSFAAGTVSGQIAAWLARGCALTRSEIGSFDLGAGPSRCR